MKLFIFASFYLVSSVALAQPFISSVDTSQLGTGKLTINGNNFGPGPSVDVFDRFESPAAQAGQPIPLTSPDIGVWTSSNGGPVYATESHSGNYSSRMQSNPQLRLNFNSGVQEVFVSYWTRVPNGTNFPGASSPGVFPSVSSWKFAWLIDQDYQGNSSDLWTTAHYGNGGFNISGNDSHTITHKLGNAWWSWNSWVRIAVWLRANPSNPTATGDVLFHTVSQEKGVAENWMSAAVFDADGPTLKQFQYINIPGWLRSGAPLYDDIYVASGANAIAHIELADSANYAQAHQVAVQPSTSWSTGKITVDVNQGDFSSLNNVYLFVWDKDGNRNATGFPLSAGGAPPLYPGNIQ